MDKAEILKLLEEWQAVGIEGMNYRFAKWFRSGFDGNTLLESPRTQKHFDLLRRTKKALKEGQTNKEKTISFRQDMIDLIVAGRKTATIRPVKDEDVSGNSIAYRYGLPGGFVRIKKSPNTALKINMVKLLRLHDIDPWTWCDDGVVLDSIDKTVNIDVVDHWDSFYGETEYRWENNPLVWVIWFKAVSKENSDE